jgi:hypothetical protein
VGDACGVVARVARAGSRSTPASDTGQRVLPADPKRVVRDRRPWPPRQQRALHRPGMHLGCPPCLLRPVTCTTAWLRACASLDGQALSSVVVTAQAGFQTESGFDWVTIGGTQYQGTAGPQSVAMAAGATIHWRSDASANGAGFTICAVGTEPAPPSIPPSPPAAPPSPSPPPPPNAPYSPVFEIISGSSACEIAAHPDSGRPQRHSTHI